MPGVGVTATGPDGSPPDDQEIAFVSGEPKRNPPRVKFAPELVAHDVRGVEDLSPGWRRGRVAVVAVSCPVLSGEHRVVRDLLEAMRPSATIAIADARSKSEDVLYFCDGLGGVDALVLDRVLRGGIRVSEDDEAGGLDLALHSENAYALDRA